MKHVVFFGSVTLLGFGLGILNGVVINGFSNYMANKIYGEE